jgi:hypothetical protein
METDNVRSIWVEYKQSTKFYVLLDQFPSLDTAKHRNQAREEMKVSSQFLSLVHRSLLHYAFDKHIVLAMFY